MVLEMPFVDFLEWYAVFQEENFEKELRWMYSIEFQSLAMSGKATNFKDYRDKVKHKISVKQDNRTNNDILSKHGKWIEKSRILLSNERGEK